MRRNTRSFNKALVPLLVLLPSCLLTSCGANSHSITYSFKKEDVKAIKASSSWGESFIIDDFSKAQETFESCLTSVLSLDGYLKEYEANPAEAESWVHFGIFTGEGMEYVCDYWLYQYNLGFIVSKQSLVVVEGHLYSAPWDDTDKFYDVAKFAFGDDYESHIVPPIN